MEKPMFPKRVLELGYKDLNDFFWNKSFDSLQDLARETGAAYQTISTYRKAWEKSVLTKKRAEI